MINHDDWTQALKNMPQCKNCISYDTDKTKEYEGKVAICSNEKSGRYKIGHLSVCCEFYNENRSSGDLEEDVHEKKQT